MCRKKEQPPRPKQRRGGALEAAILVLGRLIKTLVAIWQHSATALGTHSSAAYASGLWLGT